MRNFSAEVSEALSLNVSKYRNYFRTKSFIVLSHSPQIKSKTEKFRDFIVLLAKFHETNANGSIDVIIRGHVISPSFSSKHRFYSGFTKRKDDSWTDIKDLITYDKLRNKLNEILPVL